MESYLKKPPFAEGRHAETVARVSKSHLKRLPHCSFLLELLELAREVRAPCQDDCIQSSRIMLLISGNPLRKRKVSLTYTVVEWRQCLDDPGVYRLLWRQYVHFDPLGRSCSPTMFPYGMMLTIQSMYQYKNSSLFGQVLRELLLIVKKPIVSYLS